METTLEHIAQEFALRKNEGEQNKLRYLMYAKLGLRELNVTVLENVKSVMINLDSLNSGLVPDDFMKVYKLGYCVNGRIIELDRDSSLCINEPEVEYCEDSDNEEAAIVTDECRIANDCQCLLGGIDLNWYGGAGIWGNIYYNGVRFSYPSYPAYVSKGFYNIKENRIYVSSVCSGGQLVLEYKSNGVVAGELTYLPEELAAPIVAYIRYYNELDKGGRNAAIYYEEYRRQYSIYKNYKIRIYLKDAVKSRRKNVSQANLGR